MNTVKSTAWEDALGIFCSILAVSAFSDVISKTKESLVHTFGVPVIACIIMYFYKRLPFDST